MPEARTGIGDFLQEIDVVAGSAGDQKVIDHCGSIPYMASTDATTSREENKRRSIGSHCAFAL
jgi:hypothetical protein